MEIEKTILDSIRSRPRFKIFTEISRENYTQYLRNLLREKEDEYSGNINSEIAIITVKNDNQNFWKPTLSLRTETDPTENKTVLTGIFGPTSAVWTFFMFLYFVFGILWMVCITLWYVEKQINSNDFPWALSLSFVVLFLIFATYVASRIGQMKAKAEMQKLREFAEESVRNLEEN